MIGKNNYYLKNTKEGTKVESYSIKKFKVGAASVVIGASIFFGAGAVAQASDSISNNTTTDESLGTENKLEVAPKAQAKPVVENTRESVAAAVASKLENSEKETLNKTALTKLIEEIDGKFTNGKYASKTEDSVNKLKTALEEARTVLNNAKTQAELTQAQAKLVTATTKLQTKLEKKKEAPAVDTTNGKATVGKTATNTEKASDSNSIANSGSRDERNGKALDTNNPFRTDVATSDTDPAANQTYTAPAENANLNEIASELLKLPDAVQNNTKIQDMNDLGDKTGVSRGDVKEIQEFGGWKAINQPDGTAGKFAIARKTESGIFPVETVNTVFTNIRNGQAQYYDTYVGEQAFDRSKDYMLFLGKVRTIASETEQTFNGQPYKKSGLGGSDSFAIKSFNGIEKTFKAHSPATGSKVKVAFKTGFTGDLNGTKANYLVEVVYRQNNSEVTAYTYSFEPQPRRTLTNEKGIVTPAKDGTGRAFVRSDFNNYTLNKAEVEAKMAEAAYKPNGQAGTFTSSDIDLPVGVTEYTVRIKVTNTERMGMGYQSPLRHYALPVTGLDFSIEQDTRKLAKNLLQRVYDKLKATEERDIKGKTEATINAYKAQLENVKNLLDGELSSTRTYKDIVTAVLADQQALRTDKSKLTASNNKLLDLINENPDPRIGKTPISKEPYNTAKDEAIKAREEAQTILNQENPDPDVVAAAVSKLNEKLAELKAARAELVVAATEAQKTKLDEATAKLVKADTDGKTQDSINEYETTYNNLTRELEEAKAKAAAIKTAGDNASRLEALTAQEAVDAVLAKLEEAKAKLVDKATEEQKAELAKAEAALTPAEESSLVGTKTPASIAAYKNAVDAIQSQLTEAKAKAAELVTKAAQNNAKKADAAEAIAKVDALKVELAKANALLKDKANTRDLATAKDALKELAKVENVTDGKTTSTKDAYDAAKRDADAAVTAAEGIINNADSTPEQVAEALTEVNAKKAELEKAKAALVDKATTEQKTKLDEATAKLVKASTDGKTQESIDAYETTYNNLTRELEEAKAKAAAIKTAGDNASRLEALTAQEAVDAVLAKLEEAKAKLVDKATEEQKAELAKAEAALTPAEESSLVGTKTPASIAAYKNAVDAIQSQLTEAKAKAAELVTKAAQNNAKKADAAEAIAKVDALKVELAKANALLKDKANTRDLATAKDALKELAKVENVTDGKTTSTKDAYDAAKRDADAAVTAAEGIINNADSTPEQVAEALTEVNAKKAELEKAKAALVDKATTEQKTKLDEATAKLVKASTDGKTQESIDAYETTYNNLTRELEEAKAKAAAIKTAGDNASRLEALTAQEAVDAVLAKLEEAKAKLVDKATEEQKAELAKAEAALTPAEESSLVGTKTPASIAAYKNAVDAIQSQLTEAKAKAAELVTKAAQNNAKKADAAEAIAKVDALKVELAKANALLKDKANTRDLATAKDALKELAKVENVTDGKTTSTKDAYDAAKRDADAAVTAAEGIINNADSTPEQVAEALTEVNAKKAELEKAKAALVDKATTEQKTKLDEATAKLVKASTDGKTQESIDAYETTYNNLTRELEEAKAKAAAIKTAGDNASRLEALTAQEAVDAVLAKLEEAKAKLVDKATEEQKAELAKAEAALTPAEESSLVGTKTPASIAAYKNAVDAIQSQLTEAKAKAAELVTKAAQNNAKKADAAEAIAKVDALKVELAKANALLKDKANTRDLATAKDALKELAKVENVTDGKTTSTKDAYDAAKRDADAAVTAAEGIINNADSTPEQVAEALTNVKAKKAALEAAKAALVDKITQDQKDDLANAEENLKLADTTGKTKDSIKAYNDEVAKLSDELAAAKQAAKDLVDKGDNTGELEAYRVQAKINKLKSKLAEAAKLLKDIDKSAAKKEVEEAAKKATDAIVANNDLTSEQKEAAKAKVAEEATKAIAAIDKATTEDDVTTAKESGKLGIEKEAAKAEIEAAKAAKEKAIEANADLTPEQKAAAKAKVAEEATKATDAIDKATTKDGVTTATDAGKLGIEKEAAKAEIEAAKSAKEKAIETNAELTSEQKAAAKAKVAEEATKATDAIDKATTKDGVTTATDAGKLGIEKEAAKAEIEAAKSAKEKAIETNAELTSEQKAAAKAKVAEEATKATDAIDKATTKDGVTTATDAGKLGIEKEAAKAEIEAAKSSKEKAIEANDKLSDSEKQAAKEEAAKAADEAKKAIDVATDNAGVDVAKTTGTSAVEAVNPVGKEKALDAIQKATEDKLAEIDRNDKLSDKEKDKAKAEVAKAAIDAVNAINEATDQAAVDAKQTEGTTAVEAVNPVGKEKALDAIQKATEDKLAEIDRDDKLSDKEKDKAKAEVAKAAIDAVNAINAATDQAAVDAKQTEGTKAVSEVNPVGKDKAKVEIEKELSEKTKAIDSNPDLTDAQKAEAKAKLVEEAKKAIDAIDKATTTEEVTSAKESGKLAIEKEAAKAEIEAAKAAKDKTIDANPDLTDDEKAEAKARVEEEAEAAKNAIDKATELSDIDKVTETGKDDIKKVTVTSAKEEAKKAIDEALAAKENAIDARTDLTEEEKEAAKNAAREEAEAAKNAIDKATTLEDINKVLEDGKENIAKINPETLKDKAKKAIDEALAEKEKAIDARTDLTQEEKEEAKKAAREEAEAAKNAIDKATTLEDINKVLEDGKENIAKINPETLKDKAKKAIDEALAEKEKAIDARTDLLPEEKEAAKKAAREEAEAAKNAIDKATTLEDINKVLEDGKENIAKINPVGAKGEAKKAVEEALANKEKEIDESTNLTPEEKVKAKVLAREEAKAANDAIDKATSIEAIEKALRPFLYQIDQDALVFDLPTFDFEEALKSLVQGTVSIELGSDISDQDVLSKLDLPEGLEVVKIEKPTTTILGATSAKVTIKLSDGSYATVEVPVEVVKKSIDNSKGSEDSRRLEDKVRVDKTTENTIREENRSSISKEDSKTSKNTLPNTGATETNTGLAGLGLAVLGSLLAVAKRRKKDEE